MKRALIRADGSREIGLGHIMRCIGLAQGLKKAGIKSLFVIRDFEPAIRDLIQGYGFEVQLMSKGHDLEKDEAFIPSLLKQQGAELIVTDLCTDDISKRTEQYLAYLYNLKSKGSFLLTIDDLNFLDFPSDILLNPNYGAEGLAYPINNHTRYLLGPAYFIFRQEFIEAAAVERQIRGEARNILVSMGGSDLMNLTVKVLKALNNLSNGSNINLRIVSGVNYSLYRKKLLKDVLEDFKGNYEICSVDSNLASLMLWADMAITGGGLTKYETAVTGTPSIIIPQIKHQEELAPLFAREGSALFLGPAKEVSRESIAETIENLLRDRDLRAKMSARGKKLVDGKGIERILAVIVL